jgi:hypothetical protein
MDQLIKQLADRYNLVLDDRWTEWFASAGELQLPGAFRQRVSVASLLEEAPQCIWPGFMTPDILPLVGNGYGDWLCARVVADGRLGEIIHWYHGGGDWIPVGTSIEQAVLHDAVDQFRPVQPQMLRGAGEMLTIDHLDNVRAALSAGDLRQWLSRGLDADGADSAGPLESILQALADERYLDAVTGMFDSRWSTSACACDLIEATIQKAITKELCAAATARYSANPRALTRALFDPETFLEATERPTEQSGWQPTDWALIERLSREVWEQRQDLAWPIELLGWSQQRRGDRETAASSYFSGRLSSSFTNQAVRLRTHWFNQRFGKFTVAQLEELPSERAALEGADPYLALFGVEPDVLLARVTAYWLELADLQLADGQPAEAYQSYFRAGWDLGAPSIREYYRILQGVIQAAVAAGWPACAAIAEVHLQCLLRRVRR